MTKPTHPMRVSVPMIRALRFICRSTRTLPVTYFRADTVIALERRHLITIEDGAICPTSSGRAVYEDMK